MKRVKSYSSIWKVEKVIYGINDLKLPVPIPLMQLVTFFIALLIVFLFGNMFPLNLIPSILRYIGVPYGISWFLCKKTFDGKKPHKYLISLFLYAIRPKVTFGGKKIKLSTFKHNEMITCVERSERSVSN